MSNFLKKLILGNITQKSKPRFNPIERRLLNIKAIWNNDHQDDNGIEKIVELPLNLSEQQQFAKSVESVNKLLSVLRNDFFTKEVK